MRSAITIALVALSSVDAKGTDGGAGYPCRTRGPFRCPYSVAILLRALRRIGAEDQAHALLARDPATHVPINEPGFLNSLLLEMLELNARDQFTRLAARAARQIPIDDPYVGGLLFMLDSGDAREQIGILLGRDPATHAAADNPALWRSEASRRLVRGPISGKLERECLMRSCRL
jgi:hypothetical protein